MHVHGDLNNKHAGREIVELIPDPAYRYCSLAVSPLEDVEDIRERYRPFLQPGNASDGDHDWVAQLELGTTLEMVQKEILDKNADRLKILVLFGSLRKR